MPLNTKNGNWFAVSLFYEHQIKSVTRENRLWEEQIILTDATSSEDALEKAAILGKKEELEYENALGEQCQVKLGKTGIAYELGENIFDGCTLFTRFLKSSEVKSLSTPFDE